MTTPNVITQLETTLDELDLAQRTLELTLDDAHLSALHSTYTAAIKRILGFNKQTIRSTNNLLRTLKRQPTTTKP